MYMRMEVAYIEVDNLMSGSAAVIRNALLSLRDVNRVEANAQNGVVKVEFLSTVNVSRIKRKLAAMGFPARGTSTTYHRMKSFITGLVGQITS